MWRARAHRDADIHADAYAGDLQPNLLPRAHLHTDVHTHPDVDLHTYPDADTHAHAQSYAIIHTHFHKHSCTLIHGYGHTHAFTNTHGHTQTIADGNAWSVEPVGPVERNGHIVPRWAGRAKLGA